jgi:hypothetical protein
MESAPAPFSLLMVAPLLSTREGFDFGDVSGLELSKYEFDTCFCPPFNLYDFERPTFAN